MTSCPVIETLNGKVKGFVSKPTASGASEVFNFLSIPYGRPPIKDLRFKPPQSAKKWDGIFNASHTLVNCPQDVAATARHDKMLPYCVGMKHNTDDWSEDCLRLSIFTPSCKSSSKLPVMVWITGGGYQRNTCGRVNGTALAGMNNVVVVVLNFRVNVFGFLRLGDHCKGNMGLRDVLMGLRWIKDEISAFGGDSSNVTLFGESSGSGMVHLLTLSPLSKGLFHKAILQSGVALSPFFLDPNPVKTTDRFLDQLGENIKKKSEAEIFQYLQQMPVPDLKKTFSSHIADGVQFMPVVDGEVVPDNPIKLVKTGQFLQIPLMLGCTDSEAGCLLTTPMFPDYMSGPNEESIKANFSAVFFAKFPDLDKDTMYSAIKKAYFKDDGSPFKYLRMHCEFSGDGIFVVPAVMTASAHSATGQPTYFYYMRQQPDFNHNPENGKNVVKKPNFVSCDHADDLYFIWGSPFLPDSLNHKDAFFTQNEKDLSASVMTYFTNFARNSDPNIGKKVEIPWPKYETTNQDQICNRKHLELKTPICVKENLVVDKLPLFMNFLSK